MATITEPTTSDLADLTDEVTICPVCRSPLTVWRCDRRGVWRRWCVQPQCGYADVATSPGRGLWGAA